MWPLGWRVCVLHVFGPMAHPIFHLYPLFLWVKMENEMKLLQKMCSRASLVACPVEPLQCPLGADVCVTCVCCVCGSKCVTILVKNVKKRNC